MHGLALSVTVLDQQQHTHTAVKSTVKQTGLYNVTLQYNR